MSKTSQLIKHTKTTQRQCFMARKYNTYFITLTNENFLTPSSCIYVFNLAKEDFIFFS